MSTKQIPEQAAPATVLVVDPSFGARLQVELSLMTSDTARLVGQASTGMRGAELAETLQPDVIVLALDMRTMDGFEALPLLAAIAPRAAILVRASDDRHDDLARASRLGAVGHTSTAMTADELRSTIEAHTPRAPLAVYAPRRYRTWGSATSEPVGQPRRITPEPFARSGQRTSW